MTEKTYTTNPLKGKETLKRLKTALRNAPVIGTVADVVDIGKDVATGDYAGAAVNTAATVLGIVPVVGRIAGKGVKAASKLFRKTDVEEAKKLIKNPEAKKEWQDINRLPESQRQKRKPEVEQAAQQLDEGQITSKEYRAISKREQPIKSITEENFPEMPTLKNIVGSLKKDQIETGIVGLNKKIPDGTKVASRLDIPAYDNYDTWIVSIHDGSVKNGRAIGYGQSAILKGVTFESSSKASLNIARGKKSKSTIARIYGDYYNADPEDTYDLARDLLNDPDWTQIGMNPFRHSYFYDKATGSPVTRAAEVVQVGPLVLAKGVSKPTISELRQMGVRTTSGKRRMFDQGGLTTDEQTQQAFNQGGYGVAGKFTSDTGVSAAKEKGNFEGFGYKGEAKEAPAETKPYGGFQESVDMNSGGDDDKPTKPMNKKTYVSRAKQKTLQKPTSKINPMQFAPKTTPKMPTDFAETKEMAEARIKQTQKQKTVSLGETEDMAKARVKNSVFNKLKDLHKRSFIYYPEIKASGPSYKRDQIFNDPKNITDYKEYLNVKAPLIQAVLESGYLVNDLGNLDTFDFNEKTGEYSFNRNRLISNLSEENPAHVKTINDFYLKATGAKTVEELDLDNPESPWFWCSAFIHDLLIKVGAKPLETYDSYDRARAKKYANYGKKVNSLSEAESGDILLIGDPETGKIKHLTLLISDDLEKFFMPTYPEPLGRNRDYVLGLGGNQQGSSYGPSANEVNVKPFDVDEVLGIRRIDEITPEMKKRLMNDNPNYKVFLQGAVEFSEQPLSRPKKFNKGGINMEQQMSLFDEGGMKDDGLDRDPVSGNEIPPGSLAKEVRDDIPAQLSEGEYVVPADVVQYYGVKFFEDLRMEAKRGLAEMEATGRIGGEPMSVTMIAIGEAEEEEKKQKERQKKALGGIIKADEGVLAKDMSNIQKYGSFNPYDFSVVGGTRLSPIARTGQSMGLTTPDTHSKMFYHPDGRVQAVPGRMVTVNGEQKFLPNPQYIDFTTGEWSDTPPSQAKAKVTETPKEDRDDSGKSSFDFEAQRLQNENSLKVSAERLELDPKVYAGLGFFKRFKLMGEEIKAMRGQEIDKDKISSIVNDTDEGSSFDLRGILKAVTTFGFLATGNPLIPLAARIIAGISTDDDKKKDVKPTIKDSEISEGVKSKSIVPTGSSGVDTSTIEGITKASGVTPKTTAKTKTPSAKAKETFREKEAKGLTKSIGTAGGSKTAKDFEDPSDNFAGMINKGGLINKPKRNPKKPRGKGLGSK